MSLVNKVKPVALPSGLLRLLTSPALTTSLVAPKTIGIVDVASPRCSCGNVTSERRYDHHIPPYEIGCQSRQFLIFTKSPSIFDCYIHSLNVSRFAQTLMKCGQHALRFIWRAAAQEPNHRHRSLLCTGNKRPQSSKANYFDEISPSHPGRP